MWGSPWYLVTSKKLVNKVINIFDQVIKLRLLYEYLSVDWLITI